MQLATGTTSVMPIGYWNRLTGVSKSVIKEQRAELIESEGHQEAAVAQETPEEGQSAHEAPGPGLCWRCCCCLGSLLQEWVRYSPKESNPACKYDLLHLCLYDHPPKLGYTY